MRSPLGFCRAWLIAFAAWWCPGASGAAESSGDFIERGLDELTGTRLATPPKGVQVTTASKYSQSTSLAPGSIHIVTADDIQTYGFRTLGEALRMLPGVYLTNDRNYSYLGVRGFNRPGDYGSRVLLLIDGERLNDNIYDSGYYGNDFVFDVDLIERIEFVPGPGSAIYGNNAFLGVVNVITKRGGAFNGAEVSGSYGSFDAYKARGSFGKRFENGAEVLLSATGFDWEGAAHLYYPEFNAPDQNQGKAVGLDYDRGQSAFAKLSYGPVQLEAGYVDRVKGIPTGVYEQAFNDAASRTDDKRTFVTLKYDDRIAADWDAYALLGYNRFDFRGDYPYHDSGGRTLNVDWGSGEWWNGEVRFTYSGFASHKLVFGSEFQDNFKQLMRNQDAGGVTYLDKPYRSTRYGFFLQDEFRLLDSLTLLAGVRYDHYPFGSSANPRVALIWQPLDTTTFKLLYGTAFRAPNVYERFYSDGNVSAKANLSLRPESIGTLELDLEHYLTPSTRLSAALYRYKIDALINQAVDPNDGLIFFKNNQGIEGLGMEVEAEQRFANGIHGVLGYSLQRAEESQGQALTNSPQHMLKLHVSSPLWHDDYRLGLETLYFSARQAKRGHVDGYLLTNLMVNATPLSNVRLSFGVYNLWNAYYADPVGDDFVQNSIPQDGRGFRLKLTVGF
ncbi:TonB-dependent receptor plug domain-containing protein [Methylomagnum sp.]